MSPNLRKVDDIDNDGWRFIYYYDEDRLMEKQSYRPDGVLSGKAVYEWDLSVSRRSPVRWKACDKDGKLENSSEHIGFDEAGSPEEGVLYDAEGNEVYRVLLRQRS
jgi:hypothetical protein